MKGLKRISKKKKGFTLIELIIVIAILGILAFIAVPKFMGHKENAKTSADQANAKIIADAAAIAMTKDTIKAVESKGKTWYYGQKSERYYTGDALDLNYATEVTDQLSSVPKANAADGKFYIKIDDEGKITVFAGETEVYPTKNGK